MKQALRQSINLKLLFLFGLAGFVTGCGSQPGDPPDLPAPVEWMSSILVEGIVEVDGVPVEIDSIGVIFNGNDLDYLPNPCLLEDIPLDSYPISTYYLHENVTYTSSVQTVTVVYGEIAEVTTSLTRADLRGSLSLHVTVEGTDVDSFRVWIDGIDNGFGANPRIVSDITEGSHKIGIGRWIDDVLWEDCLNDVVVVANDTTDVPVVDLVKAEPLEGSIAPDLYTVDIDDQTHSLSDSWGKVIYMYFFEHT